MKKIFAIAFAAFLAVGSAFAENAGARYVHSIGFNIPIETNPWTGNLEISETNPRTGNVESYDADVDFKLRAAGFNFFYNHLQVRENRFSKISDVQFGYESLKMKDITFSYGGATVNAGDADVKFKAFNTRFMFGLGGAPINTEKVILAVHGTFGFSMKIGSNTETESVTVEGTKYSVEVKETLFGFNTFLGANCQCQVKLTDTFGLAAGLHMYTTLVGFGVDSVKTTIAGESDSDAESYGVIPGGFNVDFKFGVCWIL